MKILVTGREGQIARSLARKALDYPGIELIFAARPEIDLEVPGNIADAIARHAPVVVINAAAYTAVDKAEQEETRAFRINADAAGEAAAAAKTVGARIIQVSTDYVFDGSANGSYAEDSKVAPLGVYGRSKLAGEDHVRAANPDHLIVRTAWVYSPFGSNFVRTMLRLAADRDEVRVVGDQRGSPTSALDLADALLRMASRADHPLAVYHVAGSGNASWAEFAEETFSHSRSFGGPTAIVRAISTSEYPTPAARPVNSILDSSRFASDFGCPMPLWQSSLGKVVAAILAPTAANRGNANG